MRTDQLSEAVTLKETLEEIDLNLIRLEIAETTLKEEQMVSIRVNPSGLAHTMKMDDPFVTWLRDRMLAQRLEVVDQLAALGVEPAVAAEAEPAIP